MSLELVLGIIGTVTGVFSIIAIIVKWIKDKPNLKLISFSYEKPTYMATSGYPEDGGYWGFKSNIKLRNIGNKGTTIESIYFTLNDLKIETRGVGILPKNIHPGTSDSFQISEGFSLSFFNKIKKVIKKKGDNKFCIFIEHTYGNVTAYKEV
ncbi:MAG: hypothetical protein KKH88_04925 [Nanoarchaeota archaeon]|nr:hypothetical protein [Nanoarchaeota archaeon]